MRIEILVEGAEPQIYRLNKPNFLIGSQAGCDVVLPALGLSRKHIAVVSEDDNYFVIDQGSTNGSFINEERLVPGRKIEFTSFFPLRLGDNVLVTLLSDDDVAPHVVIKEKTGSRDVDEGTRLISAKGLQGAKTEALIKKRQQRMVKSKVPTHKPKTNWVQAVCFVALAGTLYYYFIFKDAFVEETPLPVAEVVEAPAPVAPKPVSEGPAVLILSDDQLNQESRYPEIMAGMLCTTNYEKYFCDKFPAPLGLGVAQSGTMVNVFIDGAKYFNKARTFGRPATPVMGDEAKDLEFLTAIIFLVQGVPRDLDGDLLKDMILTFVLKVPMNDGNINYISIGIFPETLKTFKSTFSLEDLNSAQSTGAKRIEHFKKYFRLY